MKTQRQYTLKLFLAEEIHWTAHTIGNLADIGCIVGVPKSAWLLQMTKKDHNLALNIYKYKLNYEDGNFSDCTIPKQNIWFTGTSAELDLVTHNMPEDSRLAIGDILEVYLPDTVKMSNGEYPKRLTNPLKPNSTDTKKLGKLYRSFTHILMLENEPIPQLVIDRFPETIKTDKDPTPIDKLDLIYWNESLSKLQTTKDYIKALYSK